MPHYIKTYDARIHKPYKHVFIWFIIIWKLFWAHFISWSYSINTMEICEVLTKLRNKILLFRFRFKLGFAKMCDFIRNLMNILYVKWVSIKNIRKCMSELHNIELHGYEYLYTKLKIPWQWPYKCLIRKKCTITRMD